MDNDTIGHRRHKRFRTPIGTIAIAIAMATLAGAARADTWHVRPDGSDTNCSGLTNAADPLAGTVPRNCAFKKPQKGVDVAAGGDTVLLHAGTYATAGTTVQGVTSIIGLSLRTAFISEPTRLTIQAAENENVVFDGGNTIDTGVVIWGTSFVTVDGIKFRRFTGDTSPSFPYGATAVNVGSPGVPSPSNLLVLSSLDIRSSTLDHSGGQFAEIAIWCSNCTGNSILSSTIEGVEPFGIVVGNDSSTAINHTGVIRGNTLLHARDNQPWVGLQGIGTNGWTVDGNYFDDHSLPSLDTDYINVTNSTDWTIVNNVFYRPPNAAIDLLNDFSGVAQHRVLNNTIECFISFDAPTPFGITSFRCGNCQILNNIIDGCDSAICLADDSTGTQLGFNDFFQNNNDDDTRCLGFGATRVGGDVFADPLFTRVSQRPDPYYRLLSTSPAIDAGDPNDQNCGVVPDDGVCDMGAFQFIPPRPPLQPSIVAVDMIARDSAVLHGSAFSDPNPGDTHQSSQWQVDLAAGNFAHPVRDSEETTTNLTSFSVGRLAVDTDYKARVRYRDSDDLWSDWSDPTLNPEAFFRTLGVDCDNPRVTSVVPANLATGVSAAVHPALTFDVPVDPASVTASTIKLLRKSLPPVQVPAILSLDGTGKIVTITPAPPVIAGGLASLGVVPLLDPDSKYKITVVGGENGVQSACGSFPAVSFASTFRTETALASSSPANNEIGVALSVAPQLVFKWAVNASTATSTTIKLKDVTSGRNVPLTSVIASGATVTLTPAAALKANHKHAVIVIPGPSGLRFTDGRQLGTKIKVLFKTGAS